MGREKRAQSLLPSFVFVAGAAAAACDGSANVIVNPPFLNSGGYGSGGRGGRIPPAQGGHGGFGASPQTVGACPVSVPASGSACQPPSEGGPFECDYGTRDRCAAMTAWCVDGVWELGGRGIGCPGSGGAGGGSAGEAPIAEGGMAGGSGSAGEAPTAEGGAAGAGGGAGDGPSTEGGAGGDGPAPDPVLDCPQAVPADGAACYKPGTLASYRCDYPTACGLYEATCTGKWQVSFHASTVDACTAGAPGN